MLVTVILNNDFSFFKLKITVKRLQINNVSIAFVLDICKRLILLRKYSLKEIYLVPNE